MCTERAADRLLGMIETEGCWTVSLVSLGESRGSRVFAYEDGLECKASLREADDGDNIVTVWQAR